MKSSSILFLISFLSYTAIAQTIFDFHKVIDETKVSKIIINSTELRISRSGAISNIKTSTTYAHVDSSELLLHTSTLSKSQILETDYEISKNGLLVKQQDIKDGEYGNLVKFFYKGNIFEKQETFDNTGNLISISFHHYDNQQKLLKDSTQFFNDGQPLNYHTYNYEYRNNQLSAMSYTASEAGGYTQYYEYDDKENLIYYKRINADNSFAMGWSYQYYDNGFVKNFYVHYPTEESKNLIVSNKFLAIDENGNWTSLQQFKDDKLQTIIERIIEYY